jgi:hypothetical protein
MAGDGANESQEGMHMLGIFKREKVMSAPVKHDTDYRPEYARKSNGEGLHEIHDGGPSDLDRGIIHAMEMEVYKIPINNPKTTKLEQIAEIVQDLTYGEMMELAATIWKFRPDQATDGITEYDLPGVMHRWSAAEIRPAPAPEAEAG